jgi:hypothetical protein
MPLGPGKYDDVCTRVREAVGLLDNKGEVSRPGGVVVIVLGGNNGNGFSCQADLRTTLLLPDMLEEIARQIRESGPLG